MHFFNKKWAFLLILTRLLSISNTDLIKKIYSKILEHILKNLNSLYELNEEMPNILHIVHKLDVFDIY